MGDRPQYLSLRLSVDDSHIVQRLHEQLGLSKSEIVKKALRLLAEQQANGPHSDAYAAGAALFGRHGDVRRQSSQLKQIVRQGLVSKRSAGTVKG
jgi:Ribbon-helix-helix protein, copG family